MIELYTWPTPNGRKISIMLEETGFPYAVHSVDIGHGEQHAPAFLRISPNNKIPAIIDTTTGLTLMESGAILLYLAEKAKMLVPADVEGRWQCLQWLMLQMASVGPMLGQTHHFHFFNPGVSDYAESRYLVETARIYGVLDARLAAHDYLAGSEYSIADIATWPWIARYERQGIDWTRFPALLAWYRRIAARPAVRRGYDVPARGESIPLPA